MDDLISRQAVLDAFWKLNVELRPNAIDAILNMVNDMPSVTLTQKKHDRPTRWIPVSERLPEDHKDVLVYTEDDNITIACYNSHKLPFNDKPIGWGYTPKVGYIKSSESVIAWMPLPQPYEPQERNDEESDQTLKDIDRAFKALEERDELLDKIRERIELEKLGYPPSAGYYKAIMKCLQIIDKYRAESEV